MVGNVNCKGQDVLSMVMLMKWLEMSTVTEKCPDYRGVPISGSPHFEVPLQVVFQYTIFQYMQGTSLACNMYNDM